MFPSTTLSTYYRINSSYASTYALIGVTVLELLPPTTLNSAPNRMTRTRISITIQPPARIAETSALVAAMTALTAAVTAFAAAFAAFAAAIAACLAATAVRCVVTTAALAPCPAVAPYVLIYLFVCKNPACVSNEITQ